MKNPTILAHLYPRKVDIRKHVSTGWARVRWPGPRPESCSQWRARVIVFRASYGADPLGLLTLWPRIRAALWRRALDHSPAGDVAPRSVRAPSAIGLLSSIVRRSSLHKFKNNIFFPHRHFAGPMQTFAGRTRGVSALGRCKHGSCSGAYLRR
ncbi:hypothetical protein EVAR_33930_1 [Eumeta japonica]|uniref:Uncharacterized protein n=1 Tax=Eumeta variegata TaxID=151549 RepID=A0A4C1VYJ8_EUMVA|nr:hypothetical protein EVAR_33930_1 [Eumeta japonica]